MKSPHGLLTIALFATALGSHNLQAGTVTNTADSGPGSLRAAIAAATNAEVIDFDPALNGETITLTSGYLLISALQLTIDATSLASGISISGNHASRVLAIVSNSDVTLKRLTLRDGKEDATNGSNGNGGALFAAGGQLTMTNCDIINSYAAFSGGGAYIGNGIQANLDRCSFRGNQGDNFGGGIYFLGTATTTVTNTVISGNRSPFGGGLLNLTSSPTLVNCTIQGNAGGGLRNESSSFPLLRNVIIWGNRNGSDSIASQQILNGPTASTDLDYCLVEGMPATLQNLDGMLPANDPKFISPISVADPATFIPTSGGDVRVYTNSPVLDVGSNGANITALDRDGRTRIQNGTIDLGAYEGGYVTFSFLHPALSPSGDENLNGLSNFTEYALGINPSGPNDPSALPRLDRISGINYLTSTQRSNATDVEVSWISSTDLSPFSWQAMIPGVDYSIHSMTALSPDRQQAVFELLGAEPTRFFRQGFSAGN